MGSPCSHCAPRKNIGYDIEYIDRDHRPDWFISISPHSKVPVLIVNNETALFDSNAIAEYLDDVTELRLHPDDPLDRAYKRAWNDYVPSFSAINHLNNAEDEADLGLRCALADGYFSKLEGALMKRGERRPYFNGKNFSLTDASYAPALMRFTFFDNLHPFGLIEKYPAVRGWRDSLMERPSVIVAVVPNFEEHWHDVLQSKGGWASKFLPPYEAA